MKKRIGILFLISVLVFTFLCTAASSGLGADEPTAEEVLAEAEAGIEALEATAAVKERLRTMARTWLRDGEKAGLTGEQLRELMQAMVRLCAAGDPERDRTRLRSACRLMIRAIGEDSSLEEVCNRLRTRLEEGETLAQAVKAVRREMEEEQIDEEDIQENNNLDEENQKQEGTEGEIDEQQQGENTAAGSGPGSGGHGEEQQEKDGSKTSMKKH